MQNCDHSWFIIVTRSVTVNFAPSRHSLQASQQMPVSDCLFQALTCNLHHFRGGSKESMGTASSYFLHNFIVEQDATVLHLSHSTIQNLTVKGNVDPLYNA